ncbi:GNAT family N-acetyltransferase [Pseudomonas akapageensis]|uniref:GNAT family N-acetyltransferase n=1 Tax=Pseudomonas akapageensis TaxID=2609961 RepID=UPI00140DDF97|nr:GNAT family N-acetyltransferase [Pseudomonas akapageensis]
MNILISMDRTNISNEELAKLYDSCKFGDMSELLASNNMNKLFASTSIGFFATDSDTGKVLGVARVFSDDFITTYIAEICVSSELRGTGLADKLLEAITTRFNHTAIFTCGFIGMERFLEKQGLSKKPKLFACSRKPYLKSGRPITH